MNYKSKTSFLGLPLVHIATTELVDGKVRPGIATGWIALGDIAWGILLSFGGISFGGITLGGIGIGILSIGGLSIGVFAVGGAALGMFAVGGAAIALHSSVGGLAVARDFALGGLAVAEHANDEAARDYFLHFGFFKAAMSLLKHAAWFGLAFLLLPLLWSSRKQIDSGGPENRE